MQRKIFDSIHRADGRC